MIVFLTGLGETDSGLRTGAPAPFTALTRARASASVTIGGRPAQVMFAGAAPGDAGLYQLNVEVPAGVAASKSVTAVVTAAGLAALPVTMAIK